MQVFNGNTTELLRCSDGSGQHRINYVILLIQHHRPHHFPHLHHQVPQSLLQKLLQTLISHKNRHIIASNTPTVSPTVGNEGAVIETRTTKAPVIDRNFVAEGLGEIGIGSVLVVVLLLFICCGLGIFGVWRFKKIKKGKKKSEAMRMQARM